MRKRLRQHVNPLKMSSLAPRERPVDVPDGPTVEVELGCGDARFLIELAEQNPDRLFIGLDIRDDFMAFGRERIADLGLDNISLEECNLIVDPLEQLFDAERIHRYHINFPDPWFKARQHNRRWLTGQAVLGMVRTLEEGGQILFQSDVWALTLEALALLEAHPALENTEGEWTFLRDSPFDVRTSRELACQDEGRQIWRLLFERGWFDG